MKVQQFEKTNLIANSQLILQTKKLGKIISKLNVLFLIIQIFSHPGKIKLWDYYVKLF